MQNSKDPKDLKSKVEGVKHISEVMQNAFRVMEAKAQMNKEKEQTKLNKQS